jgi:hypothetical protein
LLSASKNLVIPIAELGPDPGCALFFTNLTIYKPPLLNIKTSNIILGIEEVFKVLCCEKMDLDIADLGFKIFGVVILVLILLFILTWGGIMKCSTIPYWCDVYETVLGSPRVLIVHGNEGLGDPEELRLLLQDPEKAAINAVDISHIDRISSGNLKRYALVIVEKAKEMNLEQLQMFMDYVNTGGGRLVWVGDAGTVRKDGEVEKLVDTNNGKNLLDNPWVRADETDTEYNLLNFDEFLGLRYSGNYCEEFNCSSSSFSVGTMVPELTGYHPLIYGAHPALELRIVPERDLALVRQFPNASNSNIVMSLDFGSNKEGIENTFPRYVPFIATSGLGERVAYYAYPLEYLCKDNDYPNACSLLLRNLYSGMLGK